MVHTLRVPSLLILIALLGGFAFGADRIAAGTPSMAPNILFILTDDLDARSIAYMPRLTSLLANRGTTFVRSFVAFPRCCPSRASILRGQYPHNHQILGNTPPGGGFRKFHTLGRERSTVGTWLKQAGYATVLLGKYLNGYPQGVEPTFVPPGWDEWYAALGTAGYANFNYNLNENGRIVHYGSRPEDYLTDVLTRKAADFIRRGGRAGKPMFIYLATFAPHEPATPAPRHEGAFATLRAPRVPSFNEADVSDKPQRLRAIPPLTPDAIETLDALHRKRLRSLQAVDEMISTLIDALRDAGELSRTYIVFTSDNGFHMGEHRLKSGKNSPYEESIRVPLIVSGPGVPEGRRAQDLTINTDLAPTFAQIAGARAPEFVDGRSLMPLLTAGQAKPREWRQSVLVEQYRNPPEDPSRPQPAENERIEGITNWQAVRSGDFLYVEYANGERELYDLSKDPYELHNLQAKADPVFLKRFSAYLAALRQCDGASCRTAENAAPPSHR